LTDILLRCFRLGIFQPRWHDNKGGGGKGAETHVKFLSRYQPALALLRNTLRKRTIYFRNLLE
jgi:hypothetical protein